MFDSLHPSQFLRFSLSIHLNTTTGDMVQWVGHAASSGAHVGIGRDPPCMDQTCLPCESLHFDQSTMCREFDHQTAPD